MERFSTLRRCKSVPYAYYAENGLTPAQAQAIVDNSAKNSLTTAQADAIEANSAKVGITEAQASAITANSAKVGITTEQADAKEPTRLRSELLLHKLQR